ncbi:hypothetical protein MGSAQ_000432, partial [marine sediment metagenome]
MRIAFGGGRIQTHLVQDILDIAVDITLGHDAVDARRLSDDVADA